MKITVELDKEVLPFLVATAMRTVHELRRATDPGDHTRGAQEDRRHAMLLEDAIEVLKVADR